MEEKENEELDEYLDTEVKEKGFMKGVKRIFDATVFPDMIKAKKEKRKIMEEAKKEAWKEIQPQLKEHFKKQEIDKLTGKKKQDFMAKLAKGFEGVGDNMDEKIKNAFSMDSGSSEKKNPADMMGMGGGSSEKKNPADMMGMGGGMFSEEKLKSILGGRDVGGGGEDKISRLLGNTNKKETGETPEEKIKRMLE